MAQYFVGIDLGTTHCAVFYGCHGQSELTQLLIPQLTAPGRVEARPLLPSFVYTPHASELLDSDRILPWGRSETNVIVGQLARDLGAKSQGRMVQSAKSWLCHSNVSADEAILPVDAVDDIDKMSAKTALEHILFHLVAAWNHAFADAPLTEQEVVITVPASFAPAARVNTEQVAQNLGINARLMEEPLAAFYAWLADTPDWQSQLEVGDQVLVVDIGGGTTDLSLIAVTENAGELDLERIAVGRHILLGGDNMDMALTYHVANKLAQQGKTLESWQITGLTQACCQAKESLLDVGGPEEFSVTVPSRGRSLFNNAITSTLNKDEVVQLVLEGFFPQVTLDDQVQQGPREGFATLNLDYERDPAITRHILDFLRRSEALPTKVLFNGGVFNAKPIADLLLQRLRSLLPADCVLDQLQPAHLDHAVAKGATYYQYTKVNGGLKVKNGLAANYYIGIASPMPAIPGMAPPVDALCIAPLGLEEGGDEQVLPNEFSLIVGETVRFRFFQSNHAQADRLGNLINSFGVAALIELPPIELTLAAGESAPGDMVRVYLSCQVNDLGILMLRAHEVNSDRSWQIEFTVRESNG
ncbi:Hsp70 family protein [Maribrevibacterium harenarium]|uniref:Hsp70 family protein n=1 Tax=Maribrevibacterium harenarium TaxID=2589817 RepID=A0A501X563_9GAMM|nr:Hsp70 family protein [Maribrevibacterium harenarium]TPE55588.1 Hsp70 family protein [Maribrevibacterium harenarium]